MVNIISPWCNQVQVVGRDMVRSYLLDRNAVLQSTKYVDPGIYIMQQNHSNHYKIADKK